MTRFDHTVHATSGSAGGVAQVHPVRIGIT